MSTISENSNPYRFCFLLQVEYEEPEEETKYLGTFFVVKLIHPAQIALQVPWSCIPVHGVNFDDRYCVTTKD